VRVNPVDIVLALLIVVAMLRGYSKGLLGTVATYVAPVLALMVAADWSDPVRDRIATMIDGPDFLFDLLAPVIVFFLVIAFIRIGAGLLAGLLGVGKSLPGRVLGATAGALASATVLGALVLLVHALRPPPRVAIDDAGKYVASPVEETLLKIDQHLTESMLAPALASLASSVVSSGLVQGDTAELRNEVESASRKAAEAMGGKGGDEIFQFKSEPHRPRDAGKR
jgi:uncharacterized membrane protein required for colicin V production